MARHAFGVATQRVLGLMVLGALVTACSASVSAGTVADSGYATLWKLDWSAVNTDLAPLKATNSSPGVCNVGGTRQACYDADRRLIVDLRALRTDLRGAIVPSAFETANATLQAAIAEDVRGLAQRNYGIAHNDNRSFRRSNRTLRTANAEFTKAFAQYPDYVSLTPTPFK